MDTLQKGKKAQNRNIKSHHKRFLTFVVPVFLVVLMMGLILFTAIRQFHRTRQTAEDEMQERLYLQAHSIEQNIQQTFSSITVAAPLLSDSTQLSHEEMLGVMNSLKDSCGFDYVVRINADGIGFNSDNLENIDFSQRSYFQRTMQGQPDIQFLPNGKIDNAHSYIIFSVPIYNGDKVEGVLYGSYREDHFDSIFHNFEYINYPGATTLGLFSTDGTPIYLAQDDMQETDVYLSEASVFEKMAQDNMDSGTFEITHQNNTYYYQEVIVGDHDRCIIISSLSKELIKEQTKYAKDITIFLLLLAMGIALALVHFILKNHYLLQNQEQEYATLSDALKVAEKAREAKSFFLSRVSHEMRTPLNAIIGFLELAKDADAEEVRKYIKDSNIAAKQLLGVINDVLDMSSIDSGKMKIAHGPFDFKQLIQSITKIYLPICEQKSINYDTIILTPVDEWLIGDPLRLNQILMNLLGNAVKFTKSGSITMKISQHNQNSKEIFLHFEISDTGCGMSDDMMKRLFLPFEQDNAQTAQQYGGSGLGLSIVKNLVNMMDGVIDVSSELGVGTTFTVDLPFRRNDLIADPPLPKDFTFSRILVIDDSETERKYLSTVLTRMNIRFTCVDGCDSGLEALEKGFVSKDPYNVCLVDWKMPNINGMETTKRIRKQYGDKMIVIVVSAYDHEQASDKAKSAGANLFLAKPLFQSTLLNLLMTLTGGQMAVQNTDDHIVPFDNKRVLLAEDNAMNRIVAQGLLKKMNVLHDTAEDGTQAVEKFLASEPGYYNAILMDVQMPNMNGFEATSVIRSSTHLEANTIPIIALTANAFNEDIAKTLSCGMNAHVTKPIEPTLLYAALKKAFDN